MSQITVQLPDGSRKVFARPITPLEVAKSISPRLAREALAAKIDGQLVDLTRPIDRDVSLRLVTFDDDEGREV